MGAERTSAKSCCRWAPSPAPAFVRASVPVAYRPPPAVSPRPTLVAAGAPKMLAPVSAAAPLAVHSGLAPPAVPA